MIEIIIKAFYLVLPAYLANMAPVIFGRLHWLNFLARPIDGGKKIGDQYLFGQNKTWRGLVSAVIFATLISWLQAFLFGYNWFHSISLVNYPADFLLFGFLAGAGAILGDLLKSFFKRRFKIKSGQAWPIFDQLDFVVGFFIATYWLVVPSLSIMLTVFLLTLILHPLINISAYLLKIKKVWW